MSSNLEHTVCQASTTSPPAESPVPGRACAHTPICPAAFATDHDAARTVRRHPVQGWVLLCNGVVVFDDTGELLPDGRCIAPHRPSSRLAA